MPSHYGFDLLGNEDVIQPGNNQLNLSGINIPDSSLSQGSIFSNQFNPPSSVTGDIGTNGSAWSLFGGKDKFGNETKSGLGTGLGVAKGLADTYLGFEQLGLAKDSLAFSKDAFSKQFENQRRSLNTQLRDRQKARLSADPTGHQSVEEYMKQSGL